MRPVTFRLRGRADDAASLRTQVLKRLLSVDRSERPVRPRVPHSQHRPIQIQKRPDYQLFCVQSLRLVLSIPLQLNTPGCYRIEAGLALQLNMSFSALCWTTMGLALCYPTLTRGGTLLTELFGLAAAVVTLIGVLVPIFKGIRSRNPAKRSYWEKEFQDRIGSNNKWPMDERLKRRAELATSYLDADEAIRRAGVPGPAASWIAGTLAYFIALFCMLQFQELAEKRTGAAETQLAELGSPLSWTVVALISFGVSAYAFWDAANAPGKRRELQRVLVEVMALPNGADAVLARPETFVNGWNNRKRKKRIKRSTKQIADISRCYSIWAEALLNECSDPSARVLIKVVNDDGATGG